MSIFSNRYADAKQEAGEYTKAILGLVGDHDPFAILSATPDAVARIAAVVSHEELRRPEEPGKWSMLHVLCHLADSERIWAWRIRKIVAEDRPRIEGYDQDRWSERLHYDASDTAEVVAEFRAVRATNLRLIRALSPAELERVGVHTERGEESVAHLIRMYAGHDVLHLNQLERIRTSLAAAARV